MTTEAALLVGLPASASHRQLVSDVRSAAARARKSEPGERGDITRFEALSVQLEQAALAYAMDSGEYCELGDDVRDELLQAAGLPFAFGGDDAGSRIPMWLSALSGLKKERVQGWQREDRILIAICDPFTPGETDSVADSVTPPPPADRWEAEEGVRGTKAVIQRFRAQLNAATSGNHAAPPAMKPSGISNRVLTEVLREYVQGSPADRMDVPVEYRDGSKAANHFPLRCLPLEDPLRGDWDIELRLALLSIRHTEMDAVVDGAWLRNAEVSKPRPAALTDDFVYAISRRQLAELTLNGERSVAMRIFQTGLDTAIVGFYRSVVDQLLDHPGSLAVIPMFYAPSARHESVLEDFAGFREGQPWVMGEPR